MRTVLQHKREISLLVIQLLWTSNICSFYFQWLLAVKFGNHHTESLPVFSYHATGKYQRNYEYTQFHLLPLCFLLILLNISLNSPEGKTRMDAFQWTSPLHGTLSSSSLVNLCRYGCWCLQHISYTKKNDETWLMPRCSFLTSLFSKLYL